MKQRAIYALTGTLLLALALAPRATAQESDLAAEVQALKEGQAQLRKELEEVKKLVQARPAAARGGNSVAGKLFALGDNPVKGANTAKLTLVEFTDYQ